jgi:RHS repeat-associated protein
VITDSKGDTYERFEYTPYGELWIEQAAAASTLDVPYRFTGKERDKETGLYYYGARYLDPKDSRWLSVDPAMGDYVPNAGQDAGKLPGMGGVFNYVNLHMYHYAGNNPVKYTDPDGEIIFQVAQRYVMNANTYQDEKLGGSDTSVGKKGCYVTSMANSEYSFKNLKANPRNPDGLLKITRDKSNFESSTSDKFNMSRYGEGLYGNKMETTSQGSEQDNSSVLAKLDDLKNSDDTYAVFGVFKTDYGDHMVPLNDTAQNNSFKDSIVKSSENDTNSDNRFDESNLKEIRYFKISE